jgi:hypothetical protein
MAVDICLVAGPVVSWVVEALKRIPWVKRYPKVAALFIAALAGVAEAAYGTGATVTQIVRCVLQTWGVAIATHEVITEPLQRTVQAS